MESREGMITAGSGSRSKRCNIETNQKEIIKFRSTPIGLFDDECAFCHSFRSTELYGPIVCYYNGILVKPEEVEPDKVIYVHKKCLEWAPKVYYSDNDVIINLKKEIERGEQLICCKCGVKGAVLNCYYHRCKTKYHSTCALELDCSWDSVNFKMLCPAHAFKKLDGFVADVPAGSVESGSQGCVLTRNH